MFPLPSFFSSSKLLTSTTLALIPTDGVATDPPSAQTSTLNVTPGCVSINANSFGPLIHFGTINSCSQTLLNPKLFNSFSPHFTALSAFNDPDSLPPISLER